MPGWSDGLGNERHGWDCQLVGSFENAFLTIDMRVTVVRVPMK